MFLDIESFDLQSSSGGIFQNLKLMGHSWSHSFTNIMSELSSNLQ